MTLMMTLIVMVTLVTLVNRSLVAMEVGSLVARVITLVATTTGGEYVHLAWFGGSPLAVLVRVDAQVWYRVVSHGGVIHLYGHSA